MESRLDASVRELDAFAAVIGATTRHHDRYPGWDFAAVSPLREAYLEAYRNVTGKDAVVNVIHAGLECGIIASKVPGMDMISIAPTVRDLHSPDEALDLDSMEVFWRTLEELVAFLSKN
jgi:dipeptidase D